MRVFSGLTILYRDSDVLFRGMEQFLLVGFFLVCGNYTEVAMETVYIFYAGDKILVHFYDYAKDLFLRLVKSNSGVWDAQKRWFVNEAPRPEG